MNKEMIDTNTINKSLGILEQVVSKLEGTNLVVAVLGLFAFFLLVICIFKFAPKNDDKSISTQGDHSPIITGNKSSVTFGKKED
ncbi:MAG: hypothetical protein ACRC6A_10080 [Fusobacteriaceae bacterium]